VLDQWWGVNGMCQGSGSCVLGHSGVRITSVWNLTPFIMVDNEVWGESAALVFIP